ncbi:hypothetical protein [Enhygromyxa salina]|nr:hypothetical protein [Enhygromyxa salina]
MSARELATGIASCVLLLPAGCRKTPTDLSVDPDTHDPAADVPALDCPVAQAPARPRPGSSDDSDPPMVLGARFVARDRVQLTFSEGLAPTTQVNPRQFRLSMAYSNIDYGASYATGYYYDLAGSDNYEPPLVVTSLAGYDDRPEVLALQLSRPVPQDLCVNITDRRADMADVDPESRPRIGVFLHYTSRGSVGVRDLADNPMIDVGAEWALHYGARHKTVYGSEPIMRLDLLVELSCPDEAMRLSAPTGPS